MLYHQSGTAQSCHPRPGTGSEGGQGGVGFSGTIGDVGLFDRFRGDSADAADLRHLRQWAAARGGVEAFIEPKTTVTPMTMLLVAGDGEWTRRAADARAVRRMGEELAIPVYDVQKVGYPRRMRDFDARRRLERRRELRADLEES